MEKTVKAMDAAGNPIEIKLRATAAIPRIYRMKFRRDILRDMKTLRKAHSEKEDVQKAFTKAKKDFEKAEKEGDASKTKAAAKKLAKAEKEMEDAAFEVADLEVFENISYIMALHADPGIPPTIDEWLDGLSTFSIHEILPDVLELWNLNQESLSVSKKNKEKLTER